MCEKGKKIKKNLLKLKNDVIELKYRELKHREIKVKKEIEELFVKPIIRSRSYGKV